MCLSMIDVEQSVPYVTLDVLEGCFRVDRMSYFIRPTQVEFPVEMLEDYFFSNTSNSCLTEDGTDGSTRSSMSVIWAGSRFRLRCFFL